MAIKISLLRSFPPFGCRWLWRFRSSGALSLSLQFQHSRMRGSSSLPGIMVILYVTYVVCYIRHMQSCRFAFAVHVLAVLATESKCASSASLAATVNTNPVVIRRLLIDLQNAGLIRTSRGPQGGAILAKPPKNISLWHVHSAVESRELFGQHPNPPSPHCPVGQGIEKVLGYVEKRANRSFSRELQMMSLADVVRRLHRA